MATFPIPPKLPRMKTLPPPKPVPIPVHEVDGPADFAVDAAGWTLPNETEAADIITPAEAACDVTTAASVMYPVMSADVDVKPQPPAAGTDDGERLVRALDKLRIAADERTAAAVRVTGKLDGVPQHVLAVPGAREAIMTARRTRQAAATAPQTEAPAEVSSAEQNPDATPEAKAAFIATLFDSDARFRQRVALAGNRMMAQFCGLTPDEEDLVQMQVVADIRAERVVTDEQQRLRLLRYRMALGLEFLRADDTAKRAVRKYTADPTMAIEARLLDIETFCGSATVRNIVLRAWARFERLQNYLERQLDTNPDFFAGIA